MSKKRLLIVIGLILLLVLVFASILAYRQVQLGGALRLPINLPFASPSPSPLPPRQAQLIEDEQLNQENAFFFRGHFPEPLFINEGVIMGDFILEDDQNESPIRVIFTTEKGNFSVGQTQGETTNFSAQSGESLLVSIQPGFKYELRVFQAPPTTPEEQQTLDLLNQLKNDTDIQPNEYAVAANMIRNIE